MDAIDDVERWRATFEAEQHRMWRSLLAYTGDAEIAADAVAEAFAQGLMRGAAVHDPSAWAWRAAFRIAAGALSDRSRGVPAPSSAESAVDLLEAVGDVPEEVVVLIDALDRLSDVDRRVVVLCLVGGMPAADVAELVSASPGAVRVRLHRARRGLKTVLSDSMSEEISDG